MAHKWVALYAFLHTPSFSSFSVYVHAESSDSNEEHLPSVYIDRLMHLADDAPSPRPLTAIVVTIYNILKPNPQQELWEDL